MALFIRAGGDSYADHGYQVGSKTDLVKDYLQPAATFALALSIASLPFSLPMGVKAFGELVEVSGSVAVEIPGVVEVIDIGCTDQITTGQLQ